MSTKSSNYGLVNLLYEKYTRGCPVSRNQLVEHFIPTCKRIASRYVGLGVDQRDLTQQGVLGVLAAIENYDSKKGASLDTYVARRVFTVVDEYVLLNTHTEHIPLGVMKTMRASYNKKRSNNSFYDDGVDTSNFESQNLHFTTDKQDASSLSVHIDSILDSEDSSLFLEEEDIVGRIKQELSSLNPIDRNIFTEIVFNEKPVSRVAELFDTTAFKANKVVNGLLQRVQESIAIPC
ncbi:sigma-70 family RNA polymerase sigma factor [Pseudoalteromonas sp. OFAV1]|jgi:RNA polymerase sigma factor (sigma-70 family)|uniref:sigma-70 family RNA polymerase sigma factor n=1 Tax=Pseudoalteromonas sp. OFAV1 TaxID=2908892 RepID=UPI001F382110|nr:sigma-70 family RNA polymerase sigma factor [Pseudoalteromonas sp. OFAV1]MCF2900965.1 sigma-70 family RNA polymerase sigma factor [Pseudoalteromonas sp. OFAV1]